MGPFINKGFQTYNYYTFLLGQHFRVLEVELQAFLARKGLHSGQKNAFTVNQSRNKIGFAKKIAKTRSSITKKHGNGHKKAF